TLAARATRSVGAASSRETHAERRAALARSADEPIRAVHPRPTADAAIDAGSGFARVPGRAVARIGAGPAGTNADRFAVDRRARAAVGAVGGVGAGSSGERAVHPAAVARARQAVGAGRAAAVGARRRSAQAEVEAGAGLTG